MYIHLFIQTVSVSDGGDYGGVRQSVSGNTGDSENTIGTVDGTAATSENQTNTGIYSIVESLYLN